MTSLLEKLSAEVGKAFESLDLPEELGAVRVSDRPDLCQFQCNGAMAAAKQAKKNPREVAQGVVDALTQCHFEHGKAMEKSHVSDGDSSSQAPRNDVFKKIEIAGPGFINLDITDDYLAAHLSQNVDLADIGGGAGVIIDYGGANIAKAMHVGHLRAAVIGEAVKRMMKAAGYNALGDVHLGDWGTHLGMLIGDYIREGDVGLVLNTDPENPVQVETLMEDMSVRYPRASAAAKENEDLMREAQDTTVKLQNKEDPYYPVWEKISAVSEKGLKETYGLLNVEFEIWKGEACVHDLIAPMVDDLKAKNFTEESDGALIIPLAEESDKKEMPPLILYKRDGGVMYGTTDMATLVDRMRKNKPSKVIYVVDQRQSLHFEQVFRAAYKTGIVPESVELTHAGFGTMNGTDGKPFKTRAGGVMKLKDLLAMATDKARERMVEANLAEDMGEDEKEDVALKVAVAAIKFADLQNARQADYVFDLDRLTRFEGKTGPYLLYQAVRIKSLLRKAKEQDIQSGTLEDIVIEGGSRELALLLCELPEAFMLSVQNYAPHYLCDYVYRLASVFSSFYGNCHILSEEDETLRASRLALCKMTLAQIERVLDLLAIDIPERM